MKYLYILIALCISNGMFAQGHNHSDHEGGAETHKEPPHGGELLDAGKYKLEVVLDVMTSEEKLSVFMLKSNLKSLDLKDASGTATFRYKDGREITNDLKKVNSEKLYCNIGDIINGFVVVIKVNYKGKEYSGICEYPGLADHLKKSKVK